MGLFSKNPEKEKQNNEYKAKRAAQLSKLTDIQLIMLGLSDLGCGYILDDQVIEEMSARNGEVLPKLEE